MKLRDNRVDIVKGIGIILVVLGHTQMALCSFVNLFHVGLFFIASGFCFQEKYTDDIRGVKTFLLKRIKRLYLPFVLWNWGYLCFRNFFCAINIYVAYPLSIKQMALQAKNIALMSAGEQLAGACWFIRALFILEVVFVVVDFVLKKVSADKIRLLRVGFALITFIIGAWLSANSIVLPFNISTVFSVFLLFVFGMEFRAFLAKTAEKKQKSYTSFLKCFGGLIILRVLLRFGTISYDSNNYPNALFFIVAAVAGWMMCWGFAEITERYIPKLSKAITYVGKRTMSILFLHLFTFKIVTVLIIIKNGLTWDRLSSFPVLDNRWWILYLIAGVGTPLLFSFIYEKCVKVLDTKKKILVISVVGAIAVCLSVSVTEQVQQRQYEEKLNIDYSLVYNKDDYLRFNRDISEAIGDNEDELFKHFIEYGMKEGRIASTKFDVYYYRDNNGDLGELYGEDLEKYYIHFIQYGYQEGRRGRESIVEDYDCYLIAEITTDKNEVLLTVQTKESVQEFEAYIFEVPVYEYDVEGLEPVYEGTISKNLEVLIPLKDVNNKYVVMSKDEEEYKQISNYGYIENPEVYSDNKVDMPEPASKKGLQISNSWIDDVEDLNLSHAFMNLVIQDLMYSGEVNENVIPYEYKGKLYYFKADRIADYDNVISRLSESGVKITCSVVSIRRDGYDALYYPGIEMNTHTSYYALNTTDQVGTEWVEAFVTFMSTRYSGTEDSVGIISNWVVGNEVNESETYNYMGEKEIGAYLEEYTRTFRIIYNIVKTNIPKANVYVPMEPWWGIDSNTLTYGGREFLDYINVKMKHEGNIDWGVAYHAYSFPLSDPKVLNDVDRTIDVSGELTLEGYVTTDSLSSVTITMENIEVLTEYMKEEQFLTKDGEVRSIILSEQGYTSNSNVYGPCEAQQVASMVYAYYKAQMNEDIDAFIYFVQRDNEAASLGNNYYQFGLWGENGDGTYNEKMSHDVFQILDTKESPELFDYIKTVLGIESWESVIPNYREEVFGDFVSIQDLDLTKNERYNSEMSLADAIIEVQKEVVYTGTECLLEIVVQYNGKTLINDVDYDVVYLNNIETGQATVVVVGMGEYTGICVAGFMIVAE